MAKQQSILVIKLGALGDFVQALGPFAAIRAHHRQARIALLTTAPFAELGRQCGYFDEVWIDEKPRGLQVGKWLALRKRLRSAGFARIYDLQTSDRSGWYFRLLGPGVKPEWSGIAKGCSHPHANPGRDFMHTIERQAEQLAVAGIETVPPPDLSWAEADVRRFGLNDSYVLVAPGGAPGRPAKRWPYRRYLEVTQRLAEKGAQPVLLGKGPEEDVLASIAERCPQAKNLAGQTTFQDIAVLARSASCALGNDTGPMHITAVAGCPSVTLYSSDSDPALCAQRGASVTILRRGKLSELDVEEVMKAVQVFL